MNKLIIFDLDGVLFESRTMHYDTLNGALEYYGFPPITYEDHVSKYNGLPTKLKLVALGITGDDAAAIQTEKQARTLGWVYKNVKVNTAFIGLFKAFRLAGWKVAVASNAITVTVVRSLQLLGLWDLCEVAIAGDRVVNPKPDPEIYEWCMRECGSDPAHTVIVEDSPVGIEGARRTGAAVIAVRGPEEVIEKVGGLLG